MSYVTQKSNEPLYPELIWNKPENKAYAGNLLLIGGNIHGITAPSSAYATALDAGAGTVRVVLPDACKKYFTKATTPPDILFAPSTPSGSFGTASMQALLEYAAWADYVVLVGDVSKNSETAILLADFITKTTAPLCITGDVIDLLLPESETILDRKHTLIVPTFSQLQKLLIQAKWGSALTSSITFSAAVANLENYGLEYNAALVYTHENVCYVAHKGNVSITKPTKPNNSWELHAAVTAAIWAMQQPQSVFKALTTSITQMA